MEIEHLEVPALGSRRRPTLQPLDDFVDHASEAVEPQFLGRTSDASARRRTPPRHGRARRAPAIASSRGSRPIASRAVEPRSRCCATNVSSGTKATFDSATYMAAKRGVQCAALAADDDRQRTLHRLREERGESVTRMTATVCRRSPSGVAHRPDDRQCLSRCSKPLLNGGNGRAGHPVLGFVPPAPRPSSTRPPDIWFDLGDGDRQRTRPAECAGETSVPRRMSLVSRAKPGVCRPRVRSGLADR